MYMRKFLAIFILLSFNYLVYASPVDKARLLSLLNQAEFYIISGNYELATELRDRSIAMVKELGAGNDNSTILKLHKLSHAFSERKMFGEAAKTETALVDVFPLALPNDTLEYALYLSDLSLYLLEDKDIVNAEKNIKKALSLIRDENNPDYALIYIRAAEIYIDTDPQRLDLSIEYQRRAVDFYADKYGKTSQKYLDELVYLAKYYDDSDDFGNACNIYLEILHTRADDSDEKDLQSFLPILDRIIYCSRKINNTEQEKQCKELAFSIALQMQEFHQAKYASTGFPSVKDSLDELKISNKLKSYKDLLAKYENDEVKNKQVKEEIEHYLTAQPASYGTAYALSVETLRESLKLNSEGVIEYGIKALQIFDDLGIKTDLYVVVLCSVAIAYKDLNNPAKAYDYILRAYELRDDYLSSNNIYYNGILNDFAVICSELGNYRDAIKYGLLFLESEKASIYSDNSYRYFYAWNNVATYYGAIGENDRELEILQHIVHRAEEIDPAVLEIPESPFLFNLASSFLKNGDYEQAIETGIKVKTKREKWGQKAFLSYIDILLARAYRMNGQIEQALYFAKQANSIQKEIGGLDNLSLSNSYSLLALIYRDMAEFNKAEEMERRSMELACNNVINNFVGLSSDDRYSYWMRLSDIFNVCYPNYFLQAKIEDASELYNKSALFAKGILINAETNLSKLIIDSGDEKSYAKFRQLLHNRSVLSQLSLGKEPHVDVSADSLRIATEKIERQLIKECKAFGDYTTNLRTTWKDVQNALGPNDVAVEFLSFPLIDKTDSIPGLIQYVALVLRKTDVYPHCIILFSEDELNQVGNNLSNKTLYNLIWGEIDKYLSGIDNVYFSPAGKLYNINIEALPRMLDTNVQKNYYRVSSTRNLYSERKPINDKESKAVIYGGLEYDVPISELIANREMQSNNDLSYRGEIANLDLRYGWDYLPETLIEVKTIETELNEFQISTKTFTGSLGTEASFKSLDGQPCKFIHIATHGFYYSESDSAIMHRLHVDFMASQIDEKSRSYVEDLSLARSGILMAGCNNILRGFEVPKDIEDGILFAKEIAGMNFKNVELVTLSTCDSGLGDITGDGVLGLQRAFKKAGAQSLLMSLHKVDDEATQILMVEFYKNLMSGKSKHQSLKDAQKYLREVDNGKFNDPKYWAAFIMLDGID